MIIAQIKVRGAHASVDWRKTITAGMIGAQVQMDYKDEIWDSLHKTVVFRGAVTKDAITNADVVTIPAEVVAKQGVALRVGVYGVDAENNIVIPTIWTDLGVVRDSAQSSGDTTTDPSLPVWAQIQAMIGNLDDLDTTAKNNLVAAVNEAMTKGGGTVDEDTVRQIVEDYLASNPPTVMESDPTVPAWAKQPQKPTYTAAEVGALPDTYTPPIATETTLGGVKAAAATEDMTQPVGITADGKLVTVPSPDSGGNVDLTGYATEQYVKDYAQPKGNYLTEVPEGYAKTEDIPTKPEDIGAQPEGDYALRSEIPSVPVKSVNGKTGAVSLTATDVKARPDSWMPTASDVGALPKSTVIPTVPTKVSAFDNDAGYLTEHQDLSEYAKKTEIPSVPVKSVNGKTGAVSLAASDVKARPDTWMPSASDVGAMPNTTKIPSKTSDLTNDSGFITGYTESDPTVPAWAKQPQKPTYTAAEVGALPDTYTPPNQTAQQVGADPAGTASSAVSQHNTDTAAHNDLRLALQELANRVNAALDSDDTTLDQMSEVVAYIKSNKTLIDAITTSKVNVADIVNDLVTNVADKPLSAAQGVALKGLIEELRTLIPEAYTLPVATETALGGVKPVTATEAMTQPVGVDAEGRLMTKPGSGGSGISVTGATVGQTVKIAAVDENGVPTAWEPADFPSGGESWRLVRKITLEENVTAIDISEDNDGNPFALKKIRINGLTLGTASGGQLRINVANKTDDSYSILGPYYNFRGLDTTKRHWYAESECFGIIGGKGKWSERYNTPDNTGVGAAYARSSFRTPKLDSGQPIQDRVEFLHIFSNTSGVEIAAGSDIELWGVDA